MRAAPATYRGSPAAARTVRLALGCRPYALPFVRPVRTSQTVAAIRHGWRLRLRLTEGRDITGADTGAAAVAALGLGEVAPWPGFGTPPAKLAGALARLPAELTVPAAAFDGVAQGPYAQAGQAGQALGAVDACNAALAAALAPASATPLPPELHWALDTAVLDLCGQLAQLPLARLLAAAPLQRVPVHLQVDTAVAAAIGRDQGFTAFKVKVGRRALDDEGSHVAAVRVAVGDAAALRLDANGAWPAAQARRALCMLAAQAPAWVEQPVAATDTAGLAALRQEAIVPVAADEAITGPAALAALLTAKACDVAVIKPAFVGGIRALMDAVALCHAQRVRVCLTHAFDGTVGCLAALHAAAALQLDGGCGLLPALREPVPQALQPHGGALFLGDAPGLGYGSATATAAGE